MNYKKIFAAVAVSLAFTSCGIYNKYESKASVPADAFGIVPGVTVTDNGTAQTQMSWREFFTDPLLQQLIEQALANNTDLNSARIAVEQSEASLKAAKLAYLPSFSLSPSGTIASFDYSKASKSYNLPLQMNWDVETFGSITNKKRAAQAVLLQAQCQEEAVHSNIISSVAQQYFMLMMLDRQLQILTATDSLWNASLETQKSLWENGKAYSTAVNQLESSWLNVKTQIVDTRRSIRNVENTICRLLAVTPQHVTRSTWGSYSMPQFFNNGISAQMLEQRPDIRMANYIIEEAFYNTQVARAAFFPTITLSGTVGWTNSGGGAILNPGSLLLNVMGQLTQPIFMRGKLKANLKISKLTQEDKKRKYVQAIINAGNEVNEALADCQAAAEKQAYYHRQVDVLHDAFIGTHELMDNGKASYLEVLTAQESFLNSQLSEAMNMYNGAQSLIALYIALGGGTK